MEDNDEDSYLFIYPLHNSFLLQKFNVLEQEIQDFLNMFCKTSHYIK